MSESKRTDVLLARIQDAVSDLAANYGYIPKLVAVAATRIKPPPSLVEQIRLVRGVTDSSLRDAMKEVFIANGLLTSMTMQEAEEVMAQRAAARRDSQESIDAVALRVSVIYPHIHLIYQIAEVRAETGCGLDAAKVAVYRCNGL
ncbi:MAG: hypothetical protein ABL912_14355, partial [Novosphingobium sp.]